MKSDVATFFDIHRHPQREFFKMNLEEFLAKAAQDQIFTSDTASTQCPPMPQIEDALTLNTSSWIQLQTVLIWSLTGKIADKEAVYPYRDCFQTALKQHKIQNSFQLSVVVAYLICGFRLKRSGWSSEDKNNVDDFRVFIDHILDPNRQDILASGFMCAHREANEEDANKLVERLKTESFVRIINVLKGVVYNLECKKITLTIYHLDNSMYSLLAIFPNIIFRYLESDGLNDLLGSLDAHFKEIGRLCKELTSEKITLHLRPTEDHIKKTRSLCEELGGSNWRNLTVFEASRVITNEHLHEITEESTMEEVRRYMPEYGTEKIDDLKAYGQKYPEEKRTIDWYTDQERLTPYAKALYETLFYFNWGREVKNSGGIAIGIDRDHSDFQTRAFHTGFNSAYAFGSSAPLAYLRRSDREVGKHDIHALSLRQFWRHSSSLK